LRGPQIGKRPGGIFSGELCWPIAALTLPWRISDRKPTQTKHAELA
jgi:hypothetical protein